MSLKQSELTKYPVDVTDRISWTEGVLRFAETPFEEMVPILERWYGVKIHVNGVPDNTTATGTFDSNESLRNVLHVLGGSMDFEYERNNKKVVVNFKEQPM